MTTQYGSKTTPYAHTRRDCAIATPCTTALPDANRSGLHEPANPMPLCHKYASHTRAANTVHQLLTTVRSSMIGFGPLRWDPAASERPSLRRTDIPGSLILCVASCCEQPRSECPLASATRSPACALWRVEGGGGNGLLFTTTVEAGGGAATDYSARFTASSVCTYVHLYVYALHYTCIHTTAIQTTL